jgi:mono/diheme cytochrome c family protein
MPTLGKAQDKDDNFHPGLSAVYSSGRKQIQKVDADISFVWEESSPDPRLPDGPFSANWVGQLLVRQEGQYRLHAFLLGEVSVKFGGKPVLSGKTSKLGWLTSDEFQLGFGEQQIDVQFRKTNDSARVHLYWSSDQFPLEPIPSHLLFRDKTNDAAAQIERGRSAFAAHRCNRCHVRDNDPPSPVAPAMTTIAAGMNHGWLLKKLIHSDQVSPHSRMPSFGFLPKEAKAVAAFLLSQSSKVKLSGLPKRKIKSLSDERRQGEILLRSLGCLACHRVGKHGSSAPFSGGDLTHVASKRSVEWFYDWLAQPKRLNVDHRMPVFQLTTAERHQLALALENLGQDHIPNKTIEFDATLVKQELDRQPEVGMLMPCNVIFWENDDKSTTLSAINAKEMLSVTGKDDLDELADQLNLWLQKAVDAV